MENVKSTKRLVALLLTLALVFGAVLQTPVFAAARGHHHWQQENTATPDHPQKPQHPEEPERPAEPTEPEEPEEPATPDHPQKPQHPEEPERPAEPTEPEEPEEPATPDHPQKPDRPGQGHFKGSITGGRKDGCTTIELWTEDGEEPAYTVTVGDGEFSIADVAVGKYIVKISKDDHVSREYDIDVDAGEVQLDASLNLKGDVNGDGKVNVADVARSYAHVKGTGRISDEYTKSCADVTGDDELNIGDIARAYAHVRGTKKLHD